MHIARGVLVFRTAKLVFDAAATILYSMNYIVVTKGGEYTKYAAAIHRGQLLFEVEQAHRMMALG